MTKLILHSSLFMVFILLVACGKSSTQGDTKNSKSIQAVQAEQETRDSYSVLSNAIKTLNITQFYDVLPKIKDLNFKLPEDEFLVIKILKTDTQKNKDLENVARTMLLEILQKGASKNVSSSLDVPAISLAISLNRIDLLDVLVHDNNDQSLLDTNLDILINATDRNKETPLFYAIKGQNEQLIIKIIKLGANVEMVNSSGKMAVDLLPADQFPTARDLVQNIIANNHLSINPNPQDLLRAIQTDDLETVKKILGHYSLNQFLLVDDILTRVVGLPDRPNRLAIAKILLSAGASPLGALPYSRTPLMESAVLNDDIMTDFLLKNAPQTANATFFMGVTALMMAIDSGNKNVSKILIRNSLKSTTSNSLKVVNIEQTDTYGRSALHYAILKNDVEIASLLVNDSLAQKITIDSSGLNSCAISIRYSRNVLEKIKDDKIKKEELDRSKKIRDEIIKCLPVIDYL